ncbi:SGNH/GDSL hydrolase family protein [Nocardioides sp. CFH 31398]|uniref:SGNH/GDSL hydrolase family protein n=1 Tax=Nocardioides sp. CFH 31398 TaxID=2919579 RepID=UPI001F052A86|nr:SGNH/GDSL hydrolase family protein [Nocardioides sp. CFH 31398]MCH1867910.1 SGNH/GDSL hydrolase family protein [Nocardioides sp. CFH 31398]
MRLRLPLAVLLAAPLLASAGAGQVPAAADDPGALATSYVALGDSYSSGTGTRDYLADGTDCQRSARAYPSLLAAARGWSLNLRACSGATIGDVTSTQLSALGAATDRVTVSVGGNDAGFADVLTECALPAWASDCDAAVDGAQAYVAGTLPGALSTLYGRIRAAAPDARVTVVGYPRVFMGEDCDAGTFFSPAEQTRLNRTAEELNDRLSAAASARGFAFADPTSAFTGHAVCDDVEWLNGLSNPVSESYHPNVAGHRDGYAPLVGGVTPTSADVAAARASEDALAAQQRRHAEQDARIEPKPFTAPDLTSPAVRRAARAAGVDLSDPKSVRRADRRYSWEQERAWRTQR